MCLVFAGSHGDPGVPGPVGPVGLKGKIIVLLVLHFEFFHVKIDNNKNRYLFSVLTSKYQSLTCQWNSL